MHGHGGGVAPRRTTCIRVPSCRTLVLRTCRPADAAKQAHKVLKEYGACYMHGKGAGGVLRVLQALARVSGGKEVEGAVWEGALAAVLDRVGGT